MIERSRLRRLLGIGLIVIGVLFLGQALARPAIAPLPALPALPPLPPAPALPALPRMPPLPPLPRMPPLPPAPPPPFVHVRSWFSPPLLLLGLIVLAIAWHRRGACGARAE
jgi:hypothetical protein